MSQISLGPRAVAFLLDNTLSSIDGDFYPTRLEAQLSTVERFAQYLFAVEPLSQIALATLCSSECGLRSSFTDSQSRLAQSLRTVTTRCGILSLAQGIRLGILALRHCPVEVVAKRILAFVGTDHDITDSSASELAGQLYKEKVSLDIVVFGNDVGRVAVLRKLIHPEVASQCTFLRILSSNTVLSDDVMASAIGPGKQEVQMPVSEVAKSDPWLAEALALSQGYQADHRGPLAVSLQGDKFVRPKKKGKVKAKRKPDKRRDAESGRKRK
jgi:26S proteasome regulatory subunit N10